MLVTEEITQGIPPEHDWVSMREAARRTGVSVAKLSRMAKGGRINTRPNPRDEREKLVDMKQLDQIFNLP